MSFFKPASSEATNKAVARFHMLIWSLIYGGLLALVLGVAVERSDEATGWPLVLIGGILAATGFFLIYLRSKIEVKKS